MEFMDLIRKRYSCKAFDGRRAEPAALDAILEAGRLAPTAKNLQEHRIYVIESPQGLAAVDSVTPCRYGAGTVLAVTYDKNNVFVYPGQGRDSGVEDAAIVATHMLLAAAAAGVDSCWLNFFDPAKAAQALGLPEDQELVMLMDLGYAAPGAGPLPNHSARKPLEDTVTRM